MRLKMNGQVNEKGTPIFPYNLIALGEDIAELGALEFIKRTDQDALEAAREYILSNSQIAIRLFESPGNMLEKLTLLEYEQARQLVRDTTGIDITPGEN